MLFDIVVIRIGDLVYIDGDEKIVNIVKRIYIEEIVRLMEWRFLNVCSIVFNDLLVFM